MGQRVTIQDIADELGLSRNTVSKALNNSDGLADATRDRVLRKAMEMGYKQLAFASSLMAMAQGERPHTFLGASPEKREVALFSTVYLQGPHFASLMLDAFQRELSQLGIILNTHRVSEEDILKHTLPLTFDRDRSLAIVCVEMFDRSYDEMLCSLGVPTLFVDGPARLHGENLPSDQLYMENTSQIQRVVHDLAADGCTSIGFIGNWEHCQSFFERYSAFQLGTHMEGLEVDPRHCIRQNYADGIEKILAENNSLPDAFICANDFVALDAMQALRTLGYEIPRDVAIVGFDDSAESRRSIPPLTTVHIHTQVMAYAAIELLRSRLEEPSLYFRQVYTDTELIYRASTKRA